MRIKHFNVYSIIVPRVSTSYRKVGEENVLQNAIYIVDRIKSLSCKILVRFTSPVSMRNEFSHIRINDKVSGALFNKKVAFGIPAVMTDDNGKQSKTTQPIWMHMEDWELEKTWQEYKNNILAFGRSNRNMNGEYLNFGKSGEAIRLGDGGIIILIG